MQVVDTNFIIIQTVLGFFVFLVGTLITIIVLQKDPTFSLNKIVSFGLFSISLSMFFFSIGNLPALIFDENEMNSTVTELTMKIFLTLISLSFASFLTSGFILIYGVDAAFNIKRNPFAIIYFILSFIIIWFTDSVIPIGNQGNIETGPFINVVFYPLTLFVYLIVVYIYINIFLRSDSETRKQMRMFVIGWLVAGIAMIFAGLSNFITDGRLFDLLGPLILAISMLILLQGFTHSKREIKN